MIYPLDDSIEVVFFFFISLTTLYSSVFYLANKYVPSIYRPSNANQYFTLFYAIASKHSSIMTNLGESSTQNK